MARRTKAELKEENDMLRAQNVALQEALATVTATLRLMGIQVPIYPYIPNCVPPQTYQPNPYYTDWYGTVSGTTTGLYLQQSANVTSQAYQQGMGAANQNIQMQGGLAQSQQVQAQAGSIQGSYSPSLANQLYSK